MECDTVSRRTSTAEVLAALRRDPEYWKLKSDVKNSVLGHGSVRKEIPTPDAVTALVTEELTPQRAALIDNEVLRKARHVRASGHATAGHPHSVVPAPLPLPTEILRQLGAAATALPSNREPIDFLRRLQAEWRQKLVKRLNRIAKSQKSEMRMACLRSEELRSMKWDTLLEHITEFPLDIGMYLYDSVDVLREAALVEDPNYSSGGYRVHPIPTKSGDSTTSTAAKPWGLIKVQFHVPTVLELRLQLDGLGLEHPQVGIDDDASFLELRGDMGEEVLERGLVRDARWYLQQGSPNHIRPAMWELSLDASGGPAQYGTAYIGELREHVRRYDLFVDHLVAADVKKLANADDSFFVFEDIIKEVMLLLTRDVRVIKTKACPIEPCVGTPVAGSPPGDAGPLHYPPSGVLPFRGMAYYVAPLCYLYGDVSRAYRVAFSLYTQYFCLLHSVSSATGGLLHLGGAFERLLQSQDPTLFAHMVLIGLDPLTVALPWMMVAFSGILPPDQTVLLWDRIIGFDTLLVLPITAVAIFRFRRNQLLVTKTVKQAEKLLADCVALNVTALLQFALFGDLLARTVP